MIRAVANSIFAKLVLILSATALFVNVAVFSGIHHFFGPKPGQADQGRKNVENYAQILVRDLGEPPSLARAKDYARDLGVDVRYEAPGGGGWTTSDAMPDSASADRHRRPLGPPRGGPPWLFFFKKPPRHDHFFTVRRSDGGAFTLRGPTPPDFEAQWDAIVWLVSVLTLIVALAYVLIRRILKPLNGLSAAVGELARGNLDHHIAVDRGDELGRLGRSFNEMTGRLKSLIEAKEQLLLDVSHELRSPVTRAKLSLEFVAAGDIRDEIADELREMDRMIEHLLETARLGSDHGGLALGQTDVGVVVREVAAKYPTVQVAVQDSGLVALVDEERLRRVVTNVIENAIKYSPPDRPVEIKASDRAQHLQIEVRDHGRGIPADEIERVFEPFYRVDKSRDRKTGGYGLGLSLCRKIMRAHGGEIRLNSVEGEGTVVTLVIPKHYLGL